MRTSRRTVPEKIWALGDAIACRHARLLDGPSPDALLEQLCSEALERARAGDIVLNWDPGVNEAAKGFFQVTTRIRLSEIVFDQFFNGRSGYRAQYYLSPEEGVLFNREVLQRLRQSVIQAYGRKAIEPTLDLVLASIDAPHAKVWVHGEKAAFDEAAPNTVNPERWVANNAIAGRKAPLPAHLTLDVKGAFIHPGSGMVWVDPMKEDRACDLYRKGYT